MGEPLGFDAMDIQFCEEDLAETIQVGEAVL
jgi:hypothetical protein